VCRHSEVALLRLLSWHCHSLFRHVCIPHWWQLFAVTEFISTSINNYCLDCRQQNQLHSLKSHTKCHKHYAGAHGLWRPVKRDSLICHNITYLTCDTSCFHLMSLAFDLTTFNACRALAVMWQNQKICGGIHWKRSLAWTHMGSLQPSPRPNLNSSCLRCWLFAALTCAVPLALFASPLKLGHNRPSHYLKIKDRSLRWDYAPIAVVDSTLHREYTHQIWSFELQLLQR